MFGEGRQEVNLDGCWDWGPSTRGWLSWKAGLLRLLISERETLKLETSVNRV